MTDSEKLIKARQVLGINFENKTLELQKEDPKGCEFLGSFKGYTTWKKQIKGETVQFVSVRGVGVFKVTDSIQADKSEALW